MNIAVVLSVFNFLAQNKDTIKQVIVSIENLVPDSPGSEKAKAVKGFIATALGIEEQMEQTWPFVAPIFNLFVAHVKSTPAVPAPTE